MTIRSEPLVVQILNLSLQPATIAPGLWKIRSDHVFSLAPMVIQLTIPLMRLKFFKFSRVEFLHTERNNFRINDQAAYGGLHPKLFTFYRLRTYLRIKMP